MSNTSQGASGISAAGLASIPLSSPLLKSPVLPLDEHASLVTAALREATARGKIEIPTIPAVDRTVNGVFSLAQFQSPFKTQNDRGTCWAFAGAAALEAAYRRKFNILIGHAALSCTRCNESRACGWIWRPDEDATTIRLALVSGHWLKSFSARFWC
jgi:hypothetical protein